MAAFVVVIRNYKIESSKGRFLILKVVYSNILNEANIYGSGINSFDKWYNEKQADYLKSNRQYENVAGHIQVAYNDYLEYFIEFGVFPLLLLAIILVFVVKRRPINIYEKTSLAGLLYIVCLAFVFYPSSIVSLRCLTVLFVAIYCYRLKDLFTVKIPSPYGSFFFLFLLVCSFVLSYFSYRLVKESAFFAERIDNYDSDMSKKFYDASDSSDLTKSLFSKSYVLNSSLGSDAIIQGKRSAAKTYYQKALRFSSDPVLFYKIAELYSGMSNDSAIYFYQKSIDIAPSRLYPKYLLMNHYIAKLDTAKAIRMANEIMQTNYKVRSKAVDEIIDSAKKVQIAY